MKFYILLFLSFTAIVFAETQPPTDYTPPPTESLAPTVNTQPPLYNVECPCLVGGDDLCISREICVYGVNDEGKIFVNGRDDKMELTKIALERMDEIDGDNNYDNNDADNNDDNDNDVLVNLYTPENSSMAIFYYACQRCDDLKTFANTPTSSITVPRLRIFLLSLYNQRMKYNIQYAQSDFQAFSVLNDGITDAQPNGEQQPMPIITVRPFWKNRLMLNQTCAQKQERFTQKHFIPSFLTQDECILDYEYIQYHNNPEAKNRRHTDGKIIYSLTLSYNDLYAYNIVINSSQDVNDWGGDSEICKLSVMFDSSKRSLRFFCVCNTRDCTLKVTKNNPLQSCPHELRAEFNTTIEYPYISQTSGYMTVDGLFHQDEETYCYFKWDAADNGYTVSIKKQSAKQSGTLPDGYTVNAVFIYAEVDQNFYCPFENSKKEEIVNFHATFFKNDTPELLQIFMTVMTDNSKIVNDIHPVGARCSNEGAFSDPFYSSGYGSDSSMFPCYKYFEIYSKEPVYPMMGFNIVPIAIISKGKDCYYYTMKMDYYHLGWCNETMNSLKPRILPPVITIAACPEDVDYDEAEFKRMQNILGSCPTMKAGQTHWEYQASTTNETEILCGQFLRGLKLEHGKYIPGRIEMRQVNDADLELTGLNETKHGCGFDSSQYLTLCTCYPTLGDCDDLYTAGRVHLLRYLPFGDLTNE